VSRKNGVWVEGRGINSSQIKYPPLGHSTQRDFAAVNPTIEEGKRGDDRETYIKNVHRVRDRPEKETQGDPENEEVGKRGRRSFMKKLKCLGI